MTTLNASSNITLTIPDGGSVTIQCLGPVSVEAMSGLGRTAAKIEQIVGMRTFGPYSPGGQLKLTTGAVAAQYEVAAGAPKVKQTPDFACALWSNGEMHIARGGLTLAKLSSEETRQMCDYLDRMADKEAA